MKNHINKVIINDYENNIYEMFEYYQNGSKIEKSYFDLILKDNFLRIRINNEFNSIFDVYNTILISDIDLDHTILNNKIKFVKILRCVKNNMVYGFNFNIYEEILSFENFISEYYKKDYYIYTKITDNTCKCIK
jgi:hypothetical protein